MPTPSVQGCIYSGSCVNGSLFSYPSNLLKNNFWVSD